MGGSGRGEEATHGGGFSMKSFITLPPAPRLPLSLPLAEIQGDRGMHRVRAEYPGEGVMSLFESAV